MERGKLIDIGAASAGLRSHFVNLALKHAFGEDTPALSINYDAEPGALTEAFGKLVVAYDGKGIWRDGKTGTYYAQASKDGRIEQDSDPKNAMITCIATAFINNELSSAVSPTLRSGGKRG